MSQHVWKRGTVRSAVLSDPDSAGQLLRKEVSSRSRLAKYYESRAASRAEVQSAGIVCHRGGRVKDVA